MVDFGEVVVLGGQPENGGVRMAGGRCLSRARQRGGCFERRKQRSAEEADLLTGQNRAGTVAEGFKGRRGGGRRVLRGKQLNQLGPMRGRRRAVAGQFSSSRQETGAELLAQKSRKSRLMPGVDGDGKTVCVVNGSFTLLVWPGRMFERTRNRI